VIVFQNVIVCITKDYYERKSVCNYLETKLKCLNLKFCNQSFSKIGMSLFNIFNGINGLEKSYYNEKF